MLSLFFCIFRSNLLNYLFSHKDMLLFHRNHEEFYCLVIYVSVFPAWPFFFLFLQLVNRSCLAYHESLVRECLV